MQTVRNRDKLSCSRLDCSFFQIIRPYFFQPIIFIRRENPIGLVILGEDFTAFEHHMVFEADKGNTLVGQSAFHLSVSLDCIRFVIVVGKYRLNPKGFDQIHKTHNGFAVPDLQYRFGLLRQRTKLLVQINQTAVNKGHPPILAWQGFQNMVVKNKCTKHLFALQQCVVQGGMVS